MLDLKDKFTFIFLGLAVFSFAEAQQATDLKLWYTTPSGSTWENALPVGNGQLGAMVYGNVLNETIQLNENTVWSGSPNPNDSPAALASLPELRALTNRISLPPASGGNGNPFFNVPQTLAPLISPNTNISAPALKQTWLYDLPTTAGESYTLIPMD